MKATALKCPKCGMTPTNESWDFKLVEPAIAIRPLSITVDKNGEVTQIETTDLEHDDAEGDRRIWHRGCGEFEIPAGFWDFDVYG